MAPPKSTRRRYTAEQRERALALADKNRLVAAARELGIPKTTVSNWRSRAESPAAAKPAPTPTKPKSQKRYTPSQKAEILEFVGTHRVAEAAVKFGVSKFSIYAWKKQVERAARGGGESPTSGPDPADVEALRDKEILDEWRRHPGLGPSQIRNQLRRKGIRVAVVVQITAEVPSFHGCAPRRLHRSSGAAEFLSRGLARGKDR